MFALAVPLSAQAGVVPDRVAGVSVPATPLPITEVLGEAPAGVVMSEPPAPDPPVEAGPPDSGPVPEPEPCADALAWVAAAGLPLPAGVDYLCPSTLFAHHGTACWDAWPCPGTGFIAINMNLGAGATVEYLRHVVAHEVCHILDFRDRGWSTEARADACAAAHGA